LLRELLATISAEATRAVTRANEQAARLENVASEAIETISDLHVDDTPEELLYRAHRLRGVVLNALIVIAEFQLVAGKLDTIAAIRQVYVSSE
jgi:hypothetical protein